MRDIQDLPVHEFTPLNQRRVNLGMSFAQLAEKAGVSRSTAHRMLVLGDRNTRFASIASMSDVLGVAVMFIVPDPAP